MIIRPYGIVVEGKLELGLELVIGNNRIQEIRPHTGIPQGFVCSLPFVNAHSHLEYRGMQGVLQETEYWPWIRELTRFKMEQSLGSVQKDCKRAALENKRAGVALIGEHIDRQGSEEALAEVGIDSLQFHEIITFFESENPEIKRSSALSKLSNNLKGSCLGAHSPYTVDADTLRWVKSVSQFTSIHVAETKYERELFATSSGPIAEFFRSHNKAMPQQHSSSVDYLESLKFLDDKTQIVHACDLDENDIELLVKRNCTIAHCPRSNFALQCPVSPVRKLLDAGLRVGIGLDSAASSGPIDMIAEMNQAIHSSYTIGEPLTHDQVWYMATAQGARSLWREWSELGEGWSQPFLKLNITGATSTQDLMENLQQEAIEWINPAHLED